LVINGSIVSDLDMMYIESVLQEELSLCLMLRSARTEPPSLAAALAAADAAIAQLVCPPPPADPIVLTDDVLSHLIVPAPHESMHPFSYSTVSKGNLNIFSTVECFPVFSGFLHCFLLEKVNGESVR